MMHSREDITARVIAAVATVCGAEAATMAPGTELVADLDMDSLAMFELVIELEEEYGLRISDEDIERIKTVSDIVDFIERHAG